MNAQNQTLSLTLEENAIDSLSTAIDYYFDNQKPTAWKYAILLAGHAVELFLKLALARRNPSLIYKNRRDGFAVGYADAISRLRDIGMPLTDVESALISVLRRDRDQLEHLTLSLSRSKVEVRLARVMRFLDDFLPTLQIDIGEVISDSNRFLEFKHRLQPYEAWITKAEQLAADKVPDWMVKDGANLERITCPECGVEAVAVGDGIDEPRCEHCIATWDQTAYCERCGGPVLGGFAEDDLSICETCWDHVFETS